MEILSTETIRTITTVVKVAFVLVGMLIITIHFFYAKETEKMEKKLQIFLPGSVQAAITIELTLAFVFLALSVAILILPL